jgi:itaconate CoA-transferase
LTLVEAEARLVKADTAFASVNDMASLSAHPHLRRIDLQTAAGDVSLPAPASIVVGAPRTYGAVPRLDEHKDLPGTRLREKLA